ncbi:MAG TPA: CapA family protein [Clostridiales bacterium]|nr:CapA family protein [Clostridiales bacterium]
MKIRRFVRIIALMIIIAVAVSVYFHERNAIVRDDRYEYVQSSVRNDEGSIRVVISAIGDVALGQDSRFSYRDSFDYVFEKSGGDYGYFFANARQILEQDDITIANLECVLGNVTEKAEKYDYGNNYWFIGKPEYANILKAGSIEAVSLANNHTYDYGQKGYDATCMALDEVGVKHFGYTRTAVSTINGVDVGMAGFNQLGEYEQGRDAEELKQEIESVTRELRERSDLVIVYFHWGNEYQYKADSLQTELARLAIDSGADLVLGSHPHVLQPIEIYNDRYIVYSLANFCFGGNKKPSDFDTMVYRQAFLFDQDSNLISIQAPEIIPFSISSKKSVNDYRPTPVEGEAKERIFAKLDYSPDKAAAKDLSVDKNEMVRIDEVADDIVIDLKYATSDNITGKPVYDSKVAWLRRGTANKLKKANEALMRQGYRIKVWDAYRSEKDHGLLHKIARNSYYFIDPKIGSNHTRGAAVDVTLVDMEGNELDMPSKFDEMSEKAHRTYKYATPEQKRNALILENAMKDAGFIPLENEWWHFDDSEYRSYDFLPSLQK